MDIQDYYENNQDEIFANRDELQAYKDKITDQCRQELQALECKLQKEYSDLIGKLPIPPLTMEDLTPKTPAELKREVRRKKARALRETNPIEWRIKILGKRSMAGACHGDLMERAVKNYIDHQTRHGMVIDYNLLQQYNDYYYMLHGKKSLIINAALHDK